MKRVGLFGGTFDPVHWGHLILAEQCREELELDEVLLIPALRPPHKLGQAISSAEDRVAMLSIAIAGRSDFVIDERELRREGPSYTIDTLIALREERPNDALFLLIGADSLRDLPSWREPRRILELATIVAVNRGMSPPPLDESLKRSLGPLSIPRIRLVSMPGIELSASEIRQRVRSGRSIRYLVPPSIEDYIRERRLYVS